VSQAHVEVKQTSDISGLKSCGAYATFDRASSSWRTSSAGDLFQTAEYSDKSCPTWTPSGSVQNGRAYERTKPAVRRIAESASSSSVWPTPTATDYGTNIGGSMGRVGKVRPSLRTLVRDRWSTPTASDATCGPQDETTQKDGIDGSPMAILDPRFVEALMGLPIRYTDLTGCVALETPSSGSRLE